MIWTVIFGILTVSAAILAQIAKSTFSCEGRTSGYYADVGTGCQVYHMCDGLGRQFSYTCPNATLFQQRMLICDHWYMVNCSRSEDDYSANLLIGQREKPFVDDTDSNPYYRTPRPDLLSHPTAAEYNIIYQTGKDNSNKNIVGAGKDSTSTDEPYLLPSHWSTEYSKDSTTSKPSLNSNRNYKESNFVVTNYQPGRKPVNKNKGKAIDINTDNNRVNEDVGKYKTNNFQPNQKPSINPNLLSKFNLGDTKTNNVQESAIPVNFKSNFKATTPVYPTSVDPTSENPIDAGLVPPIPYNQNNVPSSNKEETKTTYQQVNYKSSFKATTPVYPKSVEATSPDPGEVGLLPPQENGDENPDVPSLSLDFLPPIVDTSKNESKKDNLPPEKPSKFYQPPKFLPDFTVTEEPETTKSGNTVNKRNDVLRNMSSEQWGILRKSLLIPDYDFPLDGATRPSYDTDFSSFQAKSKK